MKVRNHNPTTQTVSLDTLTKKKEKQNQFSQFFCIF